MEQTKVIKGTVSSQSGAAIAGLRVQAFDKALRDERQLGEAMTGPRGEYSIAYIRSSDGGNCEAIGVRVLSPRQGAVLYATPGEDLRFHTEHVETFDVTLRVQVPSEVVEYDDLAERIKARSGRVPPEQLEESEQHRDLSWLASCLDEPLVKIEHFVLAQRMARIADATPPFFYALLRMDTLLSNDIAAPLKWRQRVDGNTDAEALVLEAALLERERIERDVTRAVKTRIVDESVLGSLGKSLEALQRLRPRAEEFEKGRQQRLTDFATRFVADDKIGKAMQIFRTNGGDIAATLKQVTSSSFLSGGGGGGDGGKEPTPPRTRPTSGTTAGRDADSGRPAPAQPTRAFAARLENDKQARIANGPALARLMNERSDLDLRSTNIDLYFKRSGLTAAEQQPLRAELKKVQRIFRLAPDYDKASGLLAQGVNSARDVTALGKTRFLREVAPAAGLSESEANAIYRKAETTSTAAMLLAGDFQDMALAAPIASINTSKMLAKLDEASADFPNLKNLFKGVDTCACEHCRSVYGPAAYLVELLEFIDKRSVTDLTTTPPTTTNAAQDVLFERRPDLGDIDLSCENANTPVPYIDLVCELLENWIAPDPGIGYNGPLSTNPDPLGGAIAPALLNALTGAGIAVTDAAQVYHTEVASGSPDTLPHYIRDKLAVVKAVNTGPNQYKLFHLRQTLLPAAELAAAPAYVNQAAYTALAGESYAFGLPFDLHHTEARAYLARFDIARPDLMRNFQVGGTPTDETIAAETLGLTAAQRGLIVNAAPANQNDFWNLPLADLKVVGTFLDKTGLTYAQLDELLAYTFIDPADSLFIKHLDLGCDLATKEIAGLDNPALDRIHRFLRLQKATGWPQAVLHEIINQPELGAGSLNDTTLAIAATLKRLSELTGIKLSELVGCYDAIPPELYAAVFLNKAKNGVIDPALQPEKIDGSGFLANVAASVALCLQVKRKDFDVLLTLLTDNKLTFTNLSRLFLLSRLMRKLKLSPNELSALIDLSGIEPTASPPDTLEFAEKAIAAKSLPLKLPDLRFMLYHQGLNAADLERRELKDATIVAMLGSLQAAYQAAYAETRSPFNPDMPAQEQLDPLAQQLGKFAEISADDAKALAGFISRDWASVPAAHALVDAVFTPLFDTAAIHTAIDALAAIPPAGDISAESAALLQAMMAGMSAYLFAQAKLVILNAQVSTTFKAGADLAAVVLARAILKQPAPGTAAVRDILLGSELIDTTNPVPVPPAITEPAFPQHFHALRLLHKLLPLAASFRIEPEVVDWLLQHAKAMGWLELDSIPYESGHTEASFQAYADLARLLQLATTLTPVEDPSDAAVPVTLWSVLEMTLPASTATRDQFLEKLALLTGHEKESLDAIDAHFFAVFSLANYRPVANWLRMLQSAEYLRRLASPLADVVDFTKPTLTAQETAKLRMALKSRYDEDTWLQTLKEIMDAIRPAKRDALVSYLLATQPGFATTNDLYDHLLVDVEMEACMPSSRIVQAHNSIQLFVQRCMMGLEPRASANTDSDSGWKQWKWLSQFRVREANMKVWCYPENWIEAELRDDKSFIFQNLEDELLQNELTEFTAERALTHYLEQLDGLAFLEVVATWYQVDERIMHVFARTKGGDPATYYHRQFQQERYWTPWVKVELEITGDQLLAFVRNRRLHLAWPIFSEDPDPNPQSTIPNNAPGTVVNADKPKRKLKIQLAISEFADGVWQPKRISKDAVRTPDTYTNGDLEQHLFNLVYIEWAGMVLLLKTTGQDSTQLRGIFNIAGCKGYPELLGEGNSYFPDFFPDFKDTLLTVQRYRESNLVPADEMAARTALSPFSFYTILNQTPGTFRLTYPHQMTLIDWVALLMQYLLLAAYGNQSGATHDHYRTIKLPLGTLLPYFKEDSNHAYVIVPGFYARRRPEPEGDEAVEVRRTASDVLNLLEAMLALYVKYAAKLQAGEPPAQVLAELLADEDYLKIVAELKVYKTLQYGEKFANMYHPLICPLRRTLYQHGVPALMARQTQMQVSGFNFGNHYQPTAIVPPPLPIQDVDFDSDGSYSGYNWELFFHVPMLIATHLTRNQRFEEARDWLHYIFNPTGALPGDVPQKYWVTKPFFLRNDADYIAQRIDTILYKSADPNTPEIKELEFAIQQWRSNPFKPHVVARFRTVAYQKAILMKYIDNLVEWGDYLFRQDTMESIAQATQMYILADKLLGPKPRTVPPVLTPPNETYYQIQAKLGPLGNALIELENILPDLSSLPEGGDELPPAPITLSMLYFCVPQNEKMLAYWDRIADRLFKIRHCQNIDGIERTLALFAPPIDPGMLVKAAASGLDISAVIAGLSAPLPYYRFPTLLQKAVDLAQEVRNLGNALLQALEKKDAEDLALLRSELEIKLQTAMSAVKKLAIEEAAEQIEVLKRTRKVTEDRHQYYAQIERVSDKEQLHLDKLADAHAMEMGSQISRMLAGVVAMVPDLLGGASGFGGSPHITLQWGGKNLAAAANSAADVFQIISTSFAYEANRASINGQNERRFDDWKQQERQAKLELDSIDKQIAAAELRHEITEMDMKNHELTIENNKKTDEFMRRKFSNRELYQWMIGQVSSIYFAAYKLAHGYARKAERAYQFELGRDDSYIAFGYWDSLKKGLQCADRLVYDLKRMETGYQDNHKRDYEIVKNISLASLDPLALVKLKTTGSCDFTVPEELFDLDHPGQYFRRNRTVSISLPCVAGPQTSVSAKLSLTSNKYRKNVAPDNLANTGYPEDPGNDERFAYNLGTIQSIATSTGQKDSGMFELSFRDERYLPFEGTGAIGTWRLELPKPALAQFNYDTIADVVLHISYTAREGGSSLRTLAETGLLTRLQEIKQELAQTGLHTMLSLKHDLPNEWHLLKQTGMVNITLDKTRLPYMAQALNAGIANVVLLAKAAGNPAMFTISLDTVETDLSRIDTWKLCKVETTAISLDTPFELALAPAELANLEELAFVVKYEFS